MKPVSLAFLWHMHQPTYRLREQPVCFMPWVRLHAIRAYYDMIRVLDEFPQMKVTINLVPSMVEQLLAYQEGAKDLFLEIGSLEPDQLGEVERAFLFDNFFSAQHDRMIRTIPAYGELLRRRHQAKLMRRAGDAWKEFSTSDYVDLIALFNLCWFGFKAREDFPELNRLLRKGAGFTTEEIAEIHAIQFAILEKIIPLHRAKQDAGQVEISTSPYAHAILPLLVNTESARESMPKHPLPPPFKYPQDAKRQVVEGLDLLERTFGRRPIGLWPSEGSVSQEVAELLAGIGLTWAATDDGILHRSDRSAPPNHHHLWEPTTPEGSLALLFRDRELSDRIGFTYQTRDPKEAARDFVGTLLSKFQADRESKVFTLVALDGENPWEHYPDSGASFLRALYGEIVNRREIQSTTVAEAVSIPGPRKKIHRVHAGSWINSDFGIWIGGSEKNRAWSILGRVREELSPHLDGGNPEDPAVQAAWRSIRAAEGSDWFWWLDGQFSSSYREQFDEAFRGHLRQAYEALGLVAPNFLHWFIPSTRIMTDGIHGEPFEWISPVVDGYEGGLFEWHGSISLSWKSLSTGSTYPRPKKPIDSVRIGFSKEERILIRVNPNGNGSPFSGLKASFSFKCEERIREIRLQLDGKGDLLESGYSEKRPEELRSSAEPVVHPSAVRVAGRKILEVSIPCEEAGLRPEIPSVLIIDLKGEALAVRIREIRLRMPSERSMTDSLGVR